MSLTSSSTLADIIAQYVDNADYDSNESVAECRLFVNACRVLLLKVPKKVRKGGIDGVETEIDPNIVRQEQLDAKVWLAPRVTPTVTRNNVKIRTVNHGGFRG